MSYRYRKASICRVRLSCSLVSLRVIIRSKARLSRLLYLLFSFITPRVLLGALGDILYPNRPIITTAYK